MPRDLDIAVPLPEYVRDVAREAGRAAAHEVLDEHRANCAIGQLAVEIWGKAPDTPGLKQHVADLRATRGALGWMVRYVLTPVIVALLTSLALLWAFGRTPVHASPTAPAAATQPVTQGVRP